MRYISRVLLLFLWVLSLAPLWADVGNFNDYSFGSNTSSFSSSSGDSDWGFSVHSSRSSDRESGSGSDSDVFFVIAIFIIAIMKTIFLPLPKMSRSTRESVAARENVYSSNKEPLRDNSFDIAAAIAEVDMNFSVEQFITFAKETFVTLQQAWSARDWEKVRPLESESLFNQHRMQLQEYIDLGRINVIERICVKKGHLFSYSRDEKGETLGVYLEVRMLDYIKCEETGQVLQGSATQDCFLRYLYLFHRESGAQTVLPGRTGTKIACPHCGAPTQVGNVGQCEFCGFLIRVSAQNWVLQDILPVHKNEDFGSGGVIIDGVLRKRPEDTAF